LLAHRYRHLVESGVNPQNILAVTFTKEMANALGARILAICPEAERGIEQICTIHAICYRILRAEGDARRVPKWWKVKKTIDEIIDDVWPARLERPGYKDVLSYINSAKAKGLGAGNDGGFYGRIAGAKLGRLVAEIRIQFDREMKSQGYLTFADMLLDMEVKLREDSTFRHRWQSRFHYVIIDEAQDTSGQAMRILATLAEPQNQLTIVGDSDQLLFRFAGATPEVNLSDGFEIRYPDGDLYKLTTNWRSTSEIVSKQLALIQHNYEGRGGPYENRYIKELQPKLDATDGEAIGFQWYDTPEGEALGVAGGILEDMTNGYKPPDFFIASRTRAQTAYIEGALVRAGVPYINLCGGSFWTLKHVQDVVGYVRLAYDQSDDKAFQRVYNIASSNMVYPWGEKKGQYCPHRYLGRAFLDASSGSYNNIHKAVQIRRSFGPGVDDLIWFMNDLQAIMATDAVADLVGFILDNCYVDHLKAEEGINIRDEAEDGKQADLATVKDIAKSFGRGVKEFLSYVNEMIEAAERARQKDWSKHVVISTVHRLKGLERKVVYGIGWCEGVDRLGFPVGLLPHTFSLRPPPQTGVLPVGGKGRIEDERCVAFVCISRAMEKVRLSGFESHMQRVYEPSRFVEEALGIGFATKETQSNPPD
jgi:DNA helicase-2/ATP-dependent DNA helicase PcrA